MKIQKFIDIQQEVEIDINAVDIAVILDEPQTDEEETKRMIYSNVTNCTTYLLGLAAADGRIAQIAPEARRIIAKRLTEVVKRLGE